MMQDGLWWLFDAPASVAFPSVRSLLPLRGVSDVVLVCDRQSGGVHLVNTRLDATISSVVVPPAISGTGTETHFATAASFNENTRSVWIGWSSGFISVFSLTLPLSSIHHQQSQLSSAIPPRLDLVETVFSHRAAVSEIVVTSGGKFMCTSSAAADGSLLFWDASSHRVLQTMQIDCEVRCIAPLVDLSGRGLGQTETKVLVGCADGLLRTVCYSLGDPSSVPRTAKTCLRHRGGVLCCHVVSRGVDAAAAWETAVWVFSGGDDGWIRAGNSRELERHPPRSAISLEEFGKVLALQTSSPKCGSASSRQHVTLIAGCTACSIVVLQFDAASVLTKRNVISTAAPVHRILPHESGCLFFVLFGLPTGAGTGWSSDRSVGFLISVQQTEGGASSSSSGGAISAAHPVTGRPANIDCHHGKSPRRSNQTASNSTIVAQQNLLMSIESHYEVKIRQFMEFVNAISDECSAIIAEASRLKLQCAKRENLSLRCSELTSALEQKNREIHVLHAQSSADAAEVERLKIETAQLASKLEDENVRCSRLTGDEARHRETIATLRADLQHISETEAAATKGCQEAIASAKRHQKAADAMQSSLLACQKELTVAMSALQEATKRGNVNSQALQHALEEVKSEQAAHIRTDKLLQDAQAELQLCRQQQSALTSTCLSLQQRLNGAIAEIANLQLIAASKSATWHNTNNNVVVVPSSNVEGSSSSKHFSAEEELALLRKRLTDVEIELAEEREESKRRGSSSVQRTTSRDERSVAEARRWIPQEMKPRAGPHGQKLIDQYSQLIESPQPPSLEQQSPSSEPPQRALDDDVVAQQSTAAPTSAHVLGLIESSIDRLQEQVVDARRRVDAVGERRNKQSAAADNQSPSTTVVSADCPPLAATHDTPKGDDATPQKVVITMKSVPQKSQANAEAVNSNPNSAVAWYNLGESLGAKETLQLDDDRQKIGKRECYVEALRCNPRYSMAWHKLGHLVNSNGPPVDVNARQYSKRECYIEGVRSDPTNSYPWSCIGTQLGTSEVFNFNGREYTRMECLVEAIRLKPSNTWAWGNLANGIAGKSDLVDVCGKQVTKMDAYVEALRLSAANNGAWKGLGDFLDGSETAVVNGKKRSKCDCYVEALCINSSHKGTWSSLSSAMDPSDTVVISGKTYTKEACLAMAQSL